jgi:hypothetical protein
MKKGFGRNGTEFDTEDQKFKTSNLKECEIYPKHIPSGAPL